MKTSTMPANRLIGNRLILGVILVMIPYTTLTIVFDYPDILRQEPGIVLTRFHTGGASLIGVWWLFAIGGFPLLQAYVLIGQKFEKQVYALRWATTLGVISAIVQLIGLLRWPFVVPVLATLYVTTTDLATRQAIVVVFTAIHQYGGVVLGEHLGQLLTIAYTLLLSRAFAQMTLFPKWISYLGYVASGIYLLAQGDLFATVIPGFPTWELAGLLGSSLWLIWLLVVGVWFRRLADAANE
ncbi:DUF4386 domain-containing protein [Spirosoma aureum]|uniref:DUF4386 domain-containing protein n=1 Tax=Spirosoma aureum TaxID=2692134 RepID=A0A6G9AUQ7_9BACT|nr:DUF4386 domain-containing protein [Spirosoma aureum]QIP16059.1 DUF4386 domain-containing protein [Spirosoma aureum]